MSVHGENDGCFMQLMNILVVLVIGGFVIGLVVMMAVAMFG